ncbi:MAG: sugar transferase [Reichenbachiella sp.]|uniref:sugar transferase n=1 Tax=Reichenbachiella sp. TaxID=2184521 RepID=UPI00326477CF
MLPCYKSIKLVLDKILAFGLLVVLFPVLLILALMVYYDQGTVFFLQRRPGLLEEPFYLLKFKTMKDGIEEDHMRVTPLGKWLRKYAMDELPQLWNVLKGEMSLIGPRPYLMEYLPLYSLEHKSRHWVLPGMTGWTQVQGGDDLSWTEKLDLDSYYALHMSFFLDLKIFYKTVWLLASGKRKDQSIASFKGYVKKQTDF